MKRDHTVYPEIVLDRVGKTGKWIGRLYKVRGPAEMVATKSGDEETYEDAVKVSQAWVAEAMKPFKIDNGEEVTIGPGDVGTLVI